MAEAADNRRRNFSFSSETPVARWFGHEILDHSPGSVRMKFMNSGRAPLLMGHDQRMVIGVIEKASIDKDRVGRSVVRFGKSERASEALRDVDDDILVNTSVGYRVYELRFESSKGEEDTYRVTDWEPLEESLVGIPADPVVGKERSQEEELEARSVRVSINPAETAVTTEVKRMADGADASAGVTAENPLNKMTGEQIENARKKAILDMCKASQLDERFVNNFISRGLSLESVADEIVKAVAERSKLQPQTPALLGMEKKDVQRYSITRALRASISRDWTKAGLELEAHRAISARGETPRGETSFFVPYDAMITQLPRRDMTVAGVSGSNFLVSTDNLSGSFIDLLRNQSVALRLGATRLTGLKGNVTIPRMTAGGTVYWLADENTQITESQPTIGQLSLVPKNVAALTEISHQLVMQSDPSVDNLVMTSIAQDIGTGVDVAALRGTGAPQPQGIIGTSGVGSVSGSSLAYPGILEFQTDVGSANGLRLGGAGYVTNFTVAGDMKATMKATNTYSPVWEGRLEEGTIDSYPALATGNMDTGDMIFGSWPTLVIAEWGVLELMMNPFSDFTRGLTSIRGWYTCDVGLRYPGAFSASTDIT